MRWQKGPDGGSDQIGDLRSTNRWWAISDRAIFRYAEGKGKKGRPCPGSGKAKVTHQHDGLIAKKAAVTTDHERGCVCQQRLRHPSQSPAEGCRASQVHHCRNTGKAPVGPWCAARCEGCVVYHAASSHAWRASSFPLPLFRGSAACRTRREGEHRSYWLSVSLHLPPRLSDRPFNACHPARSPARPHVKNSSFLCLPPSRLSTRRTARVCKRRSEREKK